MLAFLLRSGFSNGYCLRQHATASCMVRPEPQIHGIVYLWHRFFCCARFKRKENQETIALPKKKSSIVLGMQANLFFGLDLRRGGIDFKTTILSIFAFIWWRIHVFCSSKSGSPFLLSVFPFVFMFYVERKKAIRSMIREEGSVSGCSSLDSQTLGLLTKCLLIVDLV